MITFHKKFLHLLYNTMRDIFEFNHIDQTLSAEKVKILKDLYGYYHKKHYGYEKLHRGFRRKNFVCNLSAGKLIISAAVAGEITLNPAVMATLTGVGLILKAVASLKKYDKETERANFARIEYQKILDEIRFYLRGEDFNEKVFRDSLKMKDNIITEYCMEIPLSVQRKYDKKFTQL